MMWELCLSRLPRQCSGVVWSLEEVEGGSRNRSVSCREVGSGSLEESDHESGTFGGVYCPGVGNNRLADRADSCLRMRFR